MSRHVQPPQKCLTRLQIPEGFNFSHHANFHKLSGLVTRFIFTSEISPLQGASQQDLFHLDFHCFSLCPPSDHTGAPGVDRGLERGTLGPLILPLK